MGINQSVIDSVNRINQAFIDNADWWPGDMDKLAAMIHAYEEAIALRPAVAAHGGSNSEEIRFNLDVNANVLKGLKLDYEKLERKSRRPGLITMQHQLTRRPNRWHDVRGYR